MMTIIGVLIVSFSGAAVFVLAYSVLVEKVLSSSGAKTPEPLHRLFRQTRIICIAVWLVSMPAYLFLGP
jgi:hypothetical protein